MTQQKMEEAVGARCRRLGLRFALWVLVAGCGDEAAAPLRSTDGAGAEPGPASPVLEDGPQASALDVLKSNFTPLPEGLVAVSADSALYAQYARPTQRYGHAILGDAIEAGQLVVWQDGVVLTHTLEGQYVYEDLVPRLADLDGDGAFEIVTIRTHVLRGAGIAIYKVEGDSLVEHAWVREIGRSSRWLNIAAIFDLDSDGAVEIAWVQTPHIGGILRVARMAPGELEVVAESTLYSNHAIGQRNLCLSVVAAEGGAPVLYIPTHDRTRIVGLRYADDALVRVRSIEQDVDFSMPLYEQYDFGRVEQGGKDCAAN